MSPSHRPATVDLLGASHDDGLCHDHGWARDTAAERRSHPRVADAARVGTPSSTTHDDHHYAF